VAVWDISTSELIDGKEWDALANKLLRLSYVQRKADAAQIFDLITEVDAAAAAIPFTHSASSILRVLAASLRRNATFISRHPAATLQAFWNSCWWHDCPDRKAFVEAFMGAPAPFMEGSDEPGPVARLMESWRSDWSKSDGRSHWARSLVPPTTLFTGPLRLEIPVDTETGRPAALRLSKEQVVVWFRKGRKRVHARAWNRQTGEPIPEIDHKRFPFADPYLSPDNKLEVSFGGGEGGGWGQPVRVSAAGTSDVIAAFPIDDDHNVQHAAFSPDGRFVAAGAYGIDYEGYVYVWDLETRSSRGLVQLRSSVYSVVFSPGGDEVLAGCSDGHLEICRIATGTVRKSMRAHEAGITCAGFSSDDNLVASISHDGTLRVWDLAADPAGVRFAPHPDDVVEAKFSPSGDRLVTRSSNGTTWLWNGHTGKPIRRLHESSFIVQMGGDARHCLFVGNHMIVSLAHGGGVWTSSAGERLADVADNVYLGQSIAFTSDGKRFALWNRAFHDTDVITIHDIRTGDLRNMAPELNVGSDEAQGEDGQFEMIMMADGEIRTRRVPERVELARIHAHAQGVTCCAFSDNNNLLVSGGVDGVVKVWEWETASEIFSASVAPPDKRNGARHADFGQQPEPAIRNVKFMDEHTIALALGEAEIAVWDFRKGQHVKTVAWTGTLDAYPRQMPYRRSSRR
jgi:WD40 repeat protein